MRYPTASQPYAQFLLLNGILAAGFALLYFTGRAGRNMGLLLLSLLWACLCFPVEVMGCVLAAIRGRWLVAALYGAVSVALFFADHWLLEQAE